MRVIFNEEYQCHKSSLQKGPLKYGDWRLVTGDYGIAEVTDLIPIQA